MGASEEGQIRARNVSAHEKRPDAKGVEEGEEGPITGTAHFEGVGGHRLAQKLVDGLGGLRICLEI